VLLIEEDVFGRREFLILQYKTMQAPMF